MKKAIFLFSAILLTVGLAFAPLKTNKKIVVIDAGHGGHDNGVVIENTNEKDIVLNVAKKIKELNQNEDLEIILTHSDDEFLELHKRASFINKISPDFAISLHINSAKNKDKSGVEAYVYEESEHYKKSKTLAENIINAFPKELNKRDVRSQRFHITRESKCPAIILEMGFLSNDSDREYLTSEKGQTEIAKSILSQL